MRKSVLFNALFLLPILLAAQQAWDVVSIQGGPGLESAQYLDTFPGGDLLVAGRFNQAFDWSGNQLQCRGGYDIYWARVKPDGQLVWVHSAGSTLDDDVYAAVVLPAGGTALLGGYRAPFELGDTVLTSPGGLTSLLVAVTNELGVPEWGTSLRGPGLKGGGDLCGLPSGDVWICGHYQDSLHISGGPTLTGQANTCAFLASWDSQSQPVSAMSLGTAGDTRARQVMPLAEGGFVLAGIYNDTLPIGDTVLLAGTFDQDIFLCRLDGELNVAWARKLGGVFDKEITDMCLDQQGRILNTGYFTGVLKLNEEKSLMSTNAALSDGFVTVTNLDGDVLDGLAFGGPGNVRGLALCATDQGAAVAGTYTDSLVIGDSGSPDNGGTQQSGYLVLLDEQLMVQRLQVLRSDQAVYLNDLMPDGAFPYAVGSFAGQLVETGDQALGQFDLMVMQLGLPVAVPGLFPRKEPLLVYPNPAEDSIRLGGQWPITSYRLYTISGSLISQGAPPENRQWSLRGLDPGAYLLQVEVNGLWYSVKFLVDR